MSPQVSARAKNVIASPIRKYVPLINAAEASGVRFIKLHIGDPDLDAPPQILRAIRSYKGATLPYAPSAGLPRHVTAWQKYYSALGVTFAPEHFVPTAGCAEAIQLAMMAVTDPGDALLCFEPLYTGFKAAARGMRSGVPGTSARMSAMRSFMSRSTYRPTCHRVPSCTYTVGSMPKSFATSPMPSTVVSR